MKDYQEHLEGEGFKQYDRLRKYLGLIYMYGCFEAEELAQVNSRSVKDYNVVINLMLSLFWPGVKDKKKKNEIKRSPKIRREYAKSAQNRMSDSYMMFSLDRKDLLLTYLSVLQRLHGADATATELSEALKQMQDGYPAFFTDKRMGNTYQNARKWALELTYYGYVGYNEKNNRFYTFKDGLNELDRQELEQLYRYVCFAAGVTYPRVAGSFLRRTLQRELLSKSDGAQLSRLLEQSEPGSEFVLRHNSNFHVFDEEVVYCLLDMIEKRQTLKIGDEEYIPVKLRLDRRMGRWYALMACLHDGVYSPSIRAVSRLECPAAFGTVSRQQWEQARSAVEKAYSHCLFSGWREEKPVNVEVLLQFGQEQGRFEQFARELRIGTIEQTPQGAIYRAQLNDPGELLPLLRAYAPWLQVLPGEHGLHQRLEQSLRQMQENLEEVRWQAQPVNSRTFDKLSSEEGEAAAKAKKKRGPERKLLDPFQSRLVQFALDVLAYPGQQGLEEFITGRAARYGIEEPERVTALLKNAGFLGARLRLPMSRVEREYLQYILDPAYMPEVQLFLPEPLRKKLQGELPGWVEHIGLLCAPAGMALPEYPGPEGFRLLMKAIRERYTITYRYRTRNDATLHQSERLPWKLEYSAYDRRWWVILYDSKNERTIKATLNNLRDICLGEKSSIDDAAIGRAMEKLRMEENVVLRIRDTHNALQRCFTAFENQEIIQSHYAPETGYTLEFRAYRFDEDEILRQLMQLGHNVSLEGPDALRCMLQDRLDAALKKNS